MSWDILAMRFPPEVRDVAELPDDYKAPAIGTRAEIASALCSMFSGARVSQPDHVLIEGPGFCMEVGLGREVICDGFMLFVRAGDSPATIGAVKRIAEHFAVRAWDVSAGEFLDMSTDPTRSFATWRAYRDRVAGDT